MRLSCCCSRLLCYSWLCLMLAPTTHPPHTWGLSMLPRSPLVCTRNMGIYETVDTQVVHSAPAVKNSWHITCISNCHTFWAVACAAFLGPSPHYQPALPTLQNCLHGVCGLGSLARSLFAQAADGVHLILQVRTLIASRHLKQQ